MIGRVFQKTGTIRENYAPDATNPGNAAKQDFVGVAGVGPIECLLEFAIVLRPDAARNEQVCDINSARRVGCKRYRFNGRVVTLAAGPRDSEAKRPKVSVESDGPFTLVIQRRQTAIARGTSHPSDNRSLNPTEPKPEEGHQP